MTSAMPETTPVTEMGIEPLTDAETESAFFTLIGILDKLNCAPAATVGAKDGRGVTFSLHFSTDRVRRLLDARAALSTRTPEAAQVEILREALTKARDFLMSAPLESGVCCCGSAVEGHGMGDGHSPVDMLVYASQQEVERIDAALAGAAQ